MKSERRHELQHNDLAEWTMRAYQGAAPYRTLIIGVALLLAVGGIAWSFWRSHSEAQAADAWNAVEIPQAIILYPNPMLRVNPIFVNPQYADAMLRASSANAGTPAGDWARLLAADSCLYLGQSAVLLSKDESNKFYNEALKRYQESVDATTDSMARERAMFGKARTLESLGQLKEATDAYQKLNNDFPKGTYKFIATQRLEELAKPDSVEFYKALVMYNPKPKKEAEKTGTGASASSPKPEVGPRGKLESIGPLPDNPDVLPPMPQPVKPGTSGSGAAPSGPKSSAAEPVPTIPTPAAPKPTASSPVPPAPVAPAAGSGSAALGSGTKTIAPKASAAAPVPALPKSGK